MGFAGEVMSFAFGTVGTFWPVFLALAVGLAALRAWRRSHRPVLSKLSDGFPGGKHLIPKAEEEVVKARFVDFQEVARCKMQTESIVARLEIARDTLVKIKKMRESGAFADNEDLQRIYDRILSWGARGVRAIFEESGPDLRPEGDLGIPEDWYREG
jgi:hypothetical protein